MSLIRIARVRVLERIRTAPIPGAGRQSFERVHTPASFLSFWTPVHKISLRRETGKISWRETIEEGLERAPDAFLKLFTGENTGKMLVKLG